MREMVCALIRVFPSGLYWSHKIVEKYKYMEELLKTSVISFLN